MGCLRTLFIFSVFILSHICRTGAEDATELDVWNMSIEELLNVPIVSAGKNTSRYFDVPASISVIQSEELENSIFNSIQDTLRYTSGMQVASITSNIWAITIRGFSGRFANKFQVLKDGRSLYSPTYSGVFWDSVNWDLHDLSRIEIVKGPGGATWGVNSVNGVLNIISKTAHETLGGYASSDVSSNGDVSAYLRYGTMVSEDSAVQAYVKYGDWQGRPSVLEYMSDDFDAWTSLRVGARLDTIVDGEYHFSVSAEYLDNSLQERNQNLDLATFPYNWDDITSTRKGVNVDVRYDRELSSGTWTLKSYLESYTTNWYLANWDRETFDLETSFQSEPSEHHQWVVGAGYRAGTMDIDAFSEMLILLETTNTSHIYNLYFEDEVFFLDRSLSMTMGIRAEYFTYITGFEYEPSVKLSWSPSEDQIIWASVARSVRNPSFGEYNLRFLYSGMALIPTEYGESPFGYGVEGAGRATPAEKVVSFEIGYRKRFGEKALMEVSMFRSYYDDLLANDPDWQVVRYPGAFNPGLLVSGMTLESSSESYGLEFDLNYNLTEQFRIDLAYTWLKIEQKSADAGIDGVQEERTPEHQASLNMVYVHSSRFHGQLGIRYVGEMKSNFLDVPSYVELDLGVKYHWTDRVVIGLSGQNLLNQNHMEFDRIDASNYATLSERLLRLKVEVEF